MGRNRNHNHKKRELKGRLEMKKFMVLVCLVAAVARSLAGGAPAGDTARTRFPAKGSG